MRSCRPRARATAYLFVALACCWIAFTGLGAGQMKIPPVEVDSPGETGRRITEDGLIANYFPAPGKAPAALVLGGSEGGLGPDWANVARAMQSDGFSVLQLSYFRAPDRAPASNSYLSSTLLPH